MSASTVGGYGSGWLLVVAALFAFQAMYVLSIAIAASLLRVPILEVTVGVGPRLFRFRWLGVDWTLAALPLGGFTRLGGDDDFGEGGFDRLEGAQKVLVLSAGPLSTIAAGLLILMTLHALGHLEPRFLAEPARVGWVRSGSSLERGGLRPGDQVETVVFEGRTVTIGAWRELLQILSRAEGRDVILKGRRGPEPFQVGIVGGTPLVDLSHRPPSDDEEPTQMVSLPPPAALGRAVTDGIESLALGSRRVLRRGRSVDAPAPDNRYGRLVTHRFAVGRAEVLVLIGVTGILLGLLNLLPIPPLVGGNIAVVCFETIYGRELSPAVKEKLLLAGFVSLVMLMLFVIFNDLKRISWLQDWLP